MFLEKVDDVLVKKYARIVLNSNSSILSPICKENSFNFRCNVCRDSVKSQKKRRGNIVKYRGRWIFKCFNCGAVFNFDYWLKKFYYTYYRDYIREISQLYQKNDIIEEKKEEKKEEQDKEILDIKKFTPILETKGDLGEKAQSLCISRKIPESIWKYWYVGNSGRYKDRIIIPFYDNFGNIYYWQARTLIPNYEPKYLNRLMGRENAIYNYYHIDKTKPVLVVEGIIDSLFLDNSVAILGINCVPEVQKKLDELECYYILDYDNSQDTKKQCVKMIKENRYLFNWKKFIRDKHLPDREKWDINELVLYKNLKNKITYHNLKDYFTNKYFDILYFM